MLPLVEKLLVLQDRDQRIKAHRAQEKAVPAEKAAIEARRAAAEKDRDGSKERLQLSELELRKLQVEAQARRDSIGRYRAQQNLTRKNEEFQALMHEIKHAEADIQKIEDRELELMEEAERLGHGLREAEKAFKAMLATVAAQQTALAEKETNLGTRLADLGAERVTLAGEIDEDTLSLYDRILKNKGDAALVPLEHEVCQGCHMKAPGVTVSEVRASIGLVQCPNCARLLYRVV